MDNTQKPHSGAPKGNRNSLRHGLKAGSLPPGCKYVETRLNLFRRQLEDSLISIKGKVTLTDAATIQTCLRWERHAALAQRWLNKQSDSLSPSERLSFSREIAKSSTERDKCISLLGLDRDAAQDAIRTLYVIEDHNENSDRTSKQSSDVSAADED